MDRVLRYVLLVTALVLAVVGLGFALQIPFFTGMWPLPDTSPLSLAFIGSIFCAAAASTLWSLYAGENGSFAGIFLDAIVIFAPLAVYLLVIANGNSAIITFAVSLLVMLLFGILGFLWSLRFPLKDKRPLPLPVRVMFAVVVVVLILVGGALVVQVPNVLPWRVTPDGSVAYGWMFLGASSYFAYGLLRPSWMNGGGQLAGFLAYDLVLILPLVNHFSRVAPQHLTNLIIYVAVITLSALLAIYYLFVREETRVWGRAARRLTAPETAG
jgi:hypothetical protein